MIVTKMKAARTMEDLKWTRITAVIPVGVCTGASGTSWVVVFVLVASSDTFEAHPLLSRGQVLHKGFGNVSTSC